MVRQELVSNILHIESFIVESKVLKSKLRLKVRFNTSPNDRIQGPVGNTSLLYNAAQLLPR